MSFKKTISKWRRDLKEAHALRQRRLPTHHIDILGESVTIPRILLNFADILKIFGDMFTPYKTKRHIWRDFLQLFEGLKNLGVGLFHLLFSVGALIFETVLIIVALGEMAWSAIQGRYGWSIQGSALWSLTMHCAFMGLSEICLGISQIITSPLTLISITWRSFLPSNQQSEIFQDRASIKQLVAEADELIQSNEPGSVASMYKVLHSLSRKLESNVSKRQSTYFSPTPQLPVYIPFLFENRMVQVDEYTWASATEDTLGSATLAEVEKRRIMDYLKFFRVPREGAEPSRPNEIGDLDRVCVYMN